MSERELRTLKDIEIMVDVSEFNEIAAELAIVKCQTLRQEAIRWFKELQPKLYPANPTNFEYDQIIGKLAWIQMFFNLSEEDLK